MLRKSAGQAGDLVYGCFFIKLRGEQHYLWRAVDQNGDEIDILVQHKRNKQAALRFFCKLFRKTGVRPYKIVTDKLLSHRAALKELSTGHHMRRGGSKTIERNFRTNPPDSVNEK
jgi:putative transposase